jgi:putative protease
LEESAEETRQILNAYTALLSGRVEGEDLWRVLRAESQLGVTRGTL